MADKDTELLYKPTIRDFAYPKSDQRFFGHYQQVSTQQQRATSHLEKTNQNKNCNENDDENDDEEFLHFHHKTGVVSSNSLDNHSLTQNRYLFPKLNSKEEAPKQFFPSINNATANEEADNFKFNFQTLTEVLKNILKKCPALDDGINYNFYKVKALFEFKKVTEWEMDIKVGQELIVACRENVLENTVENEINNNHVYTNNSTKNIPSTLNNQNNTNDDSKITNVTKDFKNENKDENTTLTSVAETLSNAKLERWASIDVDLTSTGVDAEKGLNIFLEPDPDVFASQLREFVEYQKVYGEGWVTVLLVKVIAGYNDFDVSVNMTDLGLVPENHLEKV
ncbi:hypothetical protein HDU92_002558 [Lobulomyces angularis]|nr:hypothetical protein HDU92_002558 [Lobulomyces angularis]